MEVKAWEVKDGKLASVKVTNKGIYSIVKLRAPVEVTQLKEIKSAVEKFFDIAREVVPVRKAKKRLIKPRRPKRAKRVKKELEITPKLEEFEKELKDKFGTQEFTTKDLIQHQVEKGETESPALKSRILYNMRRLQNLKQVQRIKKGIWQIPP